MKFTGFDWGPWMGEGHGLFHKEAITKEFEELNIYEKFFEVKENDIVVDAGASIGPFTYSILSKNPKHVFCIEPSIIEHPTLEKNVSGDNVTIIKKAITPNDGDEISTYVFEQEKLLLPLKVFPLILFLKRIISIR
jgi:16S rRNA A1518/A1519 N6-dimethyltransferase RsmA/KsgA/DIM1 with predicted DNA glycosylase/AP lyase activity